MEKFSKNFKLSETFYQNFLQKNKTDVFKENILGNFVFYRTYSRKKEDGSYENWAETCKRVVEGVFTIQKIHCQNLRLLWKEEKAQKSAQKMFQKMYTLKFLPAGRGIWGMGTDFFYERFDSTLLNNCAFISTKDIAIRKSFIFKWIMNSLMLGVGVGFDTLGENEIIIKQPKFKNNEKFIIEDSKEGWTDALEHLLEGFFSGTEVKEFDFSLIRPAGTPIKGFGGIASGADPLKEMLNAINSLLTEKINKKISSIDILDICCFIARCVVAGNVRRSALICLANPNDEKLLKAKDYNLEENEQAANWRWCVNISILVDEKTNFKKIAEQSNYFERGEPGFVFLNNAKKFGRKKDPENDDDANIVGVNPCGEQFLENGELCNLVEVFPSKHSSKEEFLETLKYAFLYAKSVTLVPTLCPETNAVMLKNRRVGVGLSGLQDFFSAVSKAEAHRWFNEGYKYLKSVDNIYSDWLCVPRSKKLTTVKPSGTLSLVAGVSPGIHYPFAPYYIRRVRVSQNAFFLKYFEEAGYTIEQDKYDKNTKIICFPIKSASDKSQKDVSVWQQVANAAEMQYWWSDNAVSITVFFKEKEKQGIEQILEMFQDNIKGVSFLPLDTNTYEQAPYTAITKEEYEEEIKKIKEINLDKIFTGKEEFEQKKEMYCTNDSCSLI